VFGLGVTLAPPAGAAVARPNAAAGPAVELRGRVVQADGAPLPHARMTLRVTRANSVTCDDSGGFRMTLPLPTVATLERGPWIAQLDGTARQWRIVHAGGEPSLGLELALDRTPAGARVVARSNDEHLAALAAAAVARSETRVHDGVRFLAIGGERSSIPPAPNMTHVAGVVIESREEPAPAPVPAPPSSLATPARPEPVARSARPVKPPRARAKPAAPPAPPDPRRNEPRPADPVASGTVREERVRSVNPDPPLGPSSPPVVPRSNAATPEPPGPLVNPRRGDLKPDPHGCSCRLDGTVELVRSSVLDQPEEIVIRLEEWPAVADTVELYMGAPRAFRLAPVPCGSRRVTVDRLDPMLPPARVVTGQAMRGFGCSNGELVQPRLVIALDRGRRRR
jgi:hypothetical protein